MFGDPGMHRNFLQQSAMQTSDQMSGNPLIRHCLRFILRNTSGLLIHRLHAAAGRYGIPSGCVAGSRPTDHPAVVIWSLSTIWASDGEARPASRRCRALRGCRGDIRRAHLRTPTFLAVTESGAGLRWLKFSRMHSVKLGTRFSSCGRFAAKKQRNYGFHFMAQNEEYRLTGH
jgi:hypothetical protein